MISSISDFRVEDWEITGKFIKQNRVFARIESPTRTATIPHAFKTRGEAEAYTKTTWPDNPWEKKV